MMPLLGGQNASWTPAKLVDLEVVARKTKEQASKDPEFIKQPTTLAFKTALFLSEGSFEVPTNGKVQSIKAEYDGGDEVFDSATVTVEFMGYADDSLFGERFTLKLTVDDKDNWSVVEAKREAYGRGDHR